MCRNIAFIEVRAEILLTWDQGVPGFSCRAIFGVREDILIFRRNIHLWQRVLSRSMSCFEIKVSENKRNIMIVLNRASKTRRPRDTTRSAVEGRVDVYEKVTKTVVQEYSSLSVKVG